MDADVTSQEDSAPIEADVSPEPQSAPEPQSVPQEEPRAAQQATPWDSFKRLPEFQGQDDRAIAARLYTAMEREKAASRALAQYQQILPYAQEYLPYRQQFQEWRKQQDGPTQVQQAQQLQQQAPKPEQKFWSPPEIKESYKRYLVKDESGRTVISEDAPLEARHQLMEYQQAKADFAEKFLENPAETLAPIVQKMAAEQAQELIQERFQQVENDQFVSGIEQENADWLFDKETGNVTPEGFLVHKYIEEARDRGINGPKARWEYAVAMTERDLLAQRFDELKSQEQSQQGNVEEQLRQFLAQSAQPQVSPQPQPTPEPPKQDVASQNMQYLRREAARNPSRSAGSAVNDPRAPKPKRTFEEMLKEVGTSRGFFQ